MTIDDVVAGTAPITVHASRDGETLCGDVPGPGERVIPYETALDPSDRATFNCGRCWLAVSDREPMGGGPSDDVRG